ncbi:hypothetical protein [Paenibacillus kobensis]|uniref:hypothetical protein n=1 Tax=Paenibacillus kobensis TaxID=59841 RepID=UPI001FE498C1|nr:hypothetical protein [Paenibacillus kobensis]
MLLTTHDMADIEKTCNRMIIIDWGQMVYDGQLETIRQQYGRIRFQFHKDQMSASQLIARISEQEEIADLTIEEPEIESIIKEIYEGSAAVRETAPTDRIQVSV